MPSSDQVHSHARSSGSCVNADGSVTSRELAQPVLALRGDDVRNRKFLAEVTRRVSAALRKLGGC